MNKKVLSAILFGALMAGTGTFTSCIDNDEPQGITELRGAKAELIKAQAALTLADEAFRMAEVANQELLNEAQRLANKYAEINNEIRELDVELKRLEVEREQAATEVAKAEAEAAIANAKLQKQQREQEMAYEAEMFKAKMLGVEKQTLEAQAALDKYFAEIELAKLTMSDAEKQAIQAAIDYVTSANDALAAKHRALIDAQKAFDQALFAEAGGQSLSKLNAKLAYKKATLHVKEVLLQDDVKMLELAKNFDEETWTAQMAELDAQIQDAKKNEGLATVALTKVYVGEEYQAADDAYVAAVQTLGKEVISKSKVEDAVTSGNYKPSKVDAGVVPGDLIPDTQEKTLAAKYTEAQSDSTDAMTGITVDDVETRFSIEEYKSSALPEALARFLALDPDFTGVLSSDNKFEYAYTGDYTEADHKTDLEIIEEKGDELALSDLSTSAEKALFDMNSWIAKLEKFSPDANQQEWQKFQLEDAKGEQEDAIEEFNTAKAAWEILVKAVKDGEKTAAPIDYSVTGGVNANFKKAVENYNTAYDNLATAITNHNAALDAWKAEEDAFKAAAKEEYIADAKAGYKEDKVKERYADVFGGTVTTIYGSGNSAVTVDGLNVSGANTAYGALGTDPTIEQLKNVVVTFAVATGTEGQTGYKTAAQNATAINNAIDAWAANQTNVYYADAEKTAALETAANTAVASAVTAEYAKTGTAAAASTLVQAKNAVVASATATSVGGTNAQVVSANTALVAAWGTATGNLKSTYGEYVKRLSSVYGQAVTAKNLTKIGNDVAGTLKYVTYATATPYTATINWSTIESDFGYAATSYVNLKKADGTTDEAAIIDGNKKYQVAGSKISDAELANLSVTEIHDDLAEMALASNSSALYGNNFNTTDGDARLLPVTEAEVKAHAAAQSLAIDETNYGKLGNKMYWDAQVQLYTEMQNVDGLVAPVLEELNTQLAALKAEIAENCAVVDKFVKAAEDAYAAVVEGEKAVSAALTARDAISAEAEAEVEKYVALANELNVLKTAAQNQLNELRSGVTVQGAMTVEKLIAYWEEKVAQTAEGLETYKAEIAQVEKAIEMFEAGNYDEAYNVALYKGWLEAAQKEYDAAYAVYEAAAKQLDAVMEALLK